MKLWACSSFCCVYIASMISIQQTKISKITITRAEKNVRNVAKYTYCPRPSSNHFVRTMHHDLDVYERQVAGSMRRLQSAFNRNANSVASQRYHPRRGRQEYSHSKTNAIVNERTKPAERHMIQQDNRCSSCLKKLDRKKPEDKAQKKDETQKWLGSSPAQNSGELPIRPSENRNKIKAPKERKKDQSNELDTTNKKEQQLKEPNRVAKQEKLKVFDPAIRREQQKREFNQTSKNQQQLNSSNRDSFNREQGHFSNNKSLEQENLLQQAKAERKVLKAQNLSLKMKIQKLRKQASSSPIREAQSQELPTTRQLLYLLLKKLAPFNYSASSKEENNSQEAQMIHEKFKDSLQFGHPSKRQGSDQFQAEEGCRKNIYEKKPKDMSIQSQQFEKQINQNQKQQKQQQKREQQLLSSYSSHKKSPGKLASSIIDTKPIIIMIPGEDQHYDLLFRVPKDNQCIIRQENRR